MSGGGMSGDATAPHLAVAVIGAGAAGCLVAARLIQHAGRRGTRLDLWLIDPAHDSGRGTAYRTDDLRHLLNVPAGRMSAFAEDRDHFVRWLTGRHPRYADPDAFVPRALYGSYLAEVLEDAAVRGTSARLRRVHERAVGAQRRGTSVVCRLDSGRTVRADAVVLAVGSPAPGCDWVPRALRTSDRFVLSPWAPGALASVPHDADVLLVGTGLTMVDAALSLERPGRLLTAVSRSGLLPHPHAPAPLPPVPPPAVTGRAGLGALRREVLAQVSRSRHRHGDWRPGFDSLRPLTSSLWRQLSTADRRRFLTDHLRLWEVHRHRMAPPTAAALDRARDRGRLRMRAGEVADALVTRDGVRVSLTDGTAVEVGAVVNCTGSQPDPSAVDDPLLRDLLESGRARPHPTGLGFDILDDGRLRDGRTDTAASIWTIGALRRGELLESTAIPEIRVQADEIAGAITAVPRSRRPGDGIPQWRGISFARGGWPHRG
ncbi:FAD/NAD(P)-binding protein [Streptomyces sp. CB02923]|uniref:FAD/NAD(P)-binding protein n=1 Tax=Streptomyces sp. CB02923 TaxID=1718985 RepID=UPI00093EDF18|nr:FAD/NAD(P)-binding protein [Streptomyces sp. CB02923]